MNARDWGSELLTRHREVLTPAQVADFEAYDRDGEGWLAAYDLFRDGVDDNWLTRDELAEALALARSNQFSTMSSEAERIALGAIKASVD
jgi:hypothetical protein